jgi:Fibronectin type III domain
MSNQSNQNHRDERPGDAERHNSMRRKGARRPRRVALLGGLIGVVLGIAVIVAISNVLAGTGALQAAPRRTALNPPSDLYASGTSDGTVLLSWQPPQPPPVGYRIYRATGRHGPYAIVGEVMAPDMDTFTDSSDLMPGTTYAYTVTAFDRQGQSAPVGPIIALVLGAPGPTPTMAVPAPLPTFAAPLPPTLTSIARSSG